MDSSVELEEISEVNLPPEGEYDFHFSETEKDDDSQATDSEADEAYD